MFQKEEITYTQEEAEESGFSPEKKLKKLKEKLKQCQKEKGEYLDLAQRAKADLINYRRRQEEIMEDFQKFSQENLIRELLPVLDSLDSGLKQMPEANEGLLPIKEQLEKILKNSGLEEIKAKGEKFNPQFHEAIEALKSNEEEGTIVEEIQKGYLLYDKVLRVSKVRVAK